MVDGVDPFGIRNTAKVALDRGLRGELLLVQVYGYGNRSDDEPDDEQENSAHDRTDDHRCAM